jgi:fatty-acyl-CoA synthase
MVTLVVADEFDHGKFAEHVRRHLPDYARPVFVRTTKAIDVTGTFKQRRMELQKEGYDPGRVDDPLWFHGAGNVQPLDAELHGKIQERRVRV